MFLKTQIFQTIIESTPLVAIDFIVKYNNKILLGKRINRPARGYYFTLGGRIYKNETLVEAQKRIAKDELGIEISQKLKFIGVFEHFYSDSIFNNISTHYISHGYLLELDNKLENLPKDQHTEYRWFTAEELLASSDVHRYAKNYFKI